MNKKVVHPKELKSNLVTKLQDEIKRLKIKITTLENKVLKADTKVLKSEHKYFLIQAELDKLRKSPPKVDPVDLTNYLTKIRADQDHD